MGSWRKLTVYEVGLLLLICLLLTNDVSSFQNKRKLFKRAFMRRTSSCPNKCTCDVTGNDKKVVDCFGGEFVDIPQDIPGDVVNLNMSRNVIMTVKAGLLDNLRDIEVLDFSHNKIKEIQPSALKDLSKMRVLVLSYNEITNISLNDLRQSAIDLEVLDISSTKIRAVPELHDTTGIYMTKLTHLSMAKNYFKTISPSFIPPSVKFLDISCLNVGTLKNTALSGLGNLEELIIQGCKASKGRIKAVDHKALYTSTVLKRLDLSENDLDKVPTGLPESLVFLDLSNNRIKTIKKKECANEAIMSGRLYMTSDNKYDEYGDGQLSRPVGSALSTLSNLRELRLNGNKIASLCIDEFVNMHNLQVLNVSGCMLSSFHPHTFVYTQNLKILDLSGNQMTSFKTEELAMLEELYLQYNALRNVEKIRKERLPSLTKADFSGNQWRCNCEIKPFLQFLSRYVNDVNFVKLYAESVYYTCSLPPKLKGKSLMTVDIDNISCEEESEINIWAIAAPASLGLIIIVIVIVILVSFRRESKRRAKLRAERGIVDNDDDSEKGCCCVCCCKCCKQDSKKAYSKRIPTDSRRNYEYPSDTLVRKNALLNDAAILCNAKDQKWIINKMIPEVHRYRDEEHNKSKQRQLDLPQRKLNMNVFTVGQSIKIERLSKCIDSNRKIVLVVTHSFVEEEPCILVLNVIRERMMRDPKDSVILLILDAIAWSTMPQCLQFLMVEKTFVQYPQDCRGRQEYYFWDNVCSHMYSTSMRMLLSTVKEETDNPAFEEDPTENMSYRAPPVVSQPVLATMDQDEAPPMRPAGWNTGGRKMKGLSMNDMYMSPEREAKLRRLGLHKDGHLMNDMYGGIEEARNLGREQKKSYEAGHTGLPGTNLPMQHIESIRRSQNEDIASVHRDIDNLYSTRGSVPPPRVTSGRVRSLLPASADDADSIYSEDDEIAANMIRAPERQRSLPIARASHLHSSGAQDVADDALRSRYSGDQLHGTDKTFHTGSAMAQTAEAQNLPEAIPTMNEHEEENRSDNDQKKSKKEKKKSKKNKKKSKKKNKD